MYGNIIRGGRFAMRRGRRSIWGAAAILAGVMIILTLILPAEFWWFVLGVALIGYGVWYCRCC